MRLKITIVFNLPIIILAGLFFLIPSAMAQEGSFVTEKVTVEAFVRDECEHCQDEKAFFNDLEARRDDFEVRYHNIAEDDHRRHWEQIVELENLAKVTPITLVGNTVIQGFDTSETTGKRIEELITLSIGKETMNFEEFIAAGGSGNVESVESGTCDEDGCKIQDAPVYVTLPFLGAVDIKKYSLPLLSVILGFVDGFNPCAMWVLVSFLIILTQLGSRRKMWEFAGLFILAEAVMYYLILTFWMTAWDFVGLDNIVTPIVGLVAIGSGTFFLWQWKNSKTDEEECKVTNLEQRKRISTRIKELAGKKLTIATAVGIIGLALSVNVIEFACSIGIPQTFTKILDLNAVGVLKHQLYMALYILFYMIDDFIVFGIALYSFSKIGLTKKYSKWSHLIGGILMLVLGVIMLFKPSLLVF